jgi:hypothetical protein
VSLCFGAGCGATGTVQSVTGPSAPFSIGKFNLLSNAEYFGGNCEAHPVSLPVTVGPGQLLAYQATFAPTSTGSFNGTLTFNTTGGSATVSLAGKGTSGTSSTGLGLVTITAPERAVPGNRVEVSYTISREALTSAVDLYAAVILPSGQWLFFSETAGLTPSFVPLRRNLPPADTQGTLIEVVPVDIPFGTYTILMALVQAGKPPTADTLASPLARASATFEPLSLAQRSTLQQRGQPDSYAMLWVDEIRQKREVWRYLTPQPVEIVFVNGGLDSTQSITNPPPAGLKVDPEFFTPQTSRAQIIDHFGSPTDRSTLDNVELLSFSGGFGVIFKNGRLISVSTESP